MLLYNVVPVCVCFINTICLYRVAKVNIHVMFLTKRSIVVHVYVFRYLYIVGGLQNNISSEKCPFFFMISDINRMNS